MANLNDAELWRKRHHKILYAQTGLSQDIGMSDTFLLSGLERKRAELAGELAKAQRFMDELRKDISAIDRVLLLSGYNGKPSEIKPIVRRMPKNSMGVTSSIVLKVMSESAGPVSFSELCKGISDCGYNLSIKAISQCLNRLKSKGTIERIDGGRKPIWRIT